MKPVRHTPNLIRLTRLAAINCFLVCEDDGLTLVDTNLPRSAGGILAAAAEVGPPIRRILITHAHPDHIGSLDALCDALPGVEVLIGAREARLLAGDTILDPDEPRTRPIGVPRNVRSRPTRTLASGDRVGPLEAFASPGHTPGHMVFLDTRDGTLLGGDALFSLGGLIVAGQFRLFFPFPWMFTWDARLALRSAERIRDLNPSRLALGHGLVVEAPDVDLTRAVQGAQRPIR
jgi:glyoxylase-like metal-dependent hydrolase (beta-lactamase superfamily II)